MSDTDDPWASPLDHDHDPSTWDDDLELNHEYQLDEAVDVEAHDDIVNAGELLLEVAIEPLAPIVGVTETVESILEADSTDGDDLGVADTPHWIHQLVDGLPGDDAQWWGGHDETGGDLFVVHGLQTAESSSAEPSLALDTELLLVVADIEPSAGFVAPEGLGREGLP